MSGTAALLDRLERISARMQGARRALQAGEAVDLAPVEEDIRAVCADIAEMPETERRAFRRPLVGLMSELDDLGQLLRRGLEEVGRQLGDTGQRRQALAAYGKSGNRGPGDSGR